MFSFSNSVFYPVIDRNHHFSNMKFVFCNTFELGSVKKGAVGKELKDERLL